MTAERDMPASAERYRSLIAQVPAGIFVADASGNNVYVNDHLTKLVGQEPEKIAGQRWVDHVHPEDRPRARASWDAAVAAGRDWTEDYRVSRPDGTDRWVTATARALHDAAGALTGFVGVYTDVTERREVEQEHRAAAAEHAARRGAEAAEARLRAIVSGLAVIVWEADARTWEFTFVSERAEELLGYPVGDWLGDPDFWPAIIHPDDREEAVRSCIQGTAEGRDYDFSYRAIAADGQIVWLHDVVHVVRDADGTPRELQGVMIDTTEQKRREHATALLAEAGRLLAGPGSVEHRLTAVATLAVGVLCDLATVWLRGDDGRQRPVAAAPAEAADAVLALPPITTPGELVPAYRTGRPFAVPYVGEELLRAATANEAHYRALAAFGPRSALVVPLVADRQVVGSFSLAATEESRDYDDTDLALAGDLGQRMVTMVAAERMASRQRLLQRSVAALASADTLVEVAQVLVNTLGEAFGASAQSVYAVAPERGGLCHVYSVGYPASMIEQFTLIRLDDPVPIADCARTGEPVWLHDRDEWQVRYPHLIGYADVNGSQAATALPLRVRSQVIGILAASFSTPREFQPDECDFALALAGQAAQAFQRADEADQRRSIAETLQRSLLPPALPELPRLSLAARYLPGAQFTQAGGDWYDVLDIDTDHVALVVGDVVGKGATAAATMGQLRSALASSLLQGLSPARALEHLDHFADRITGARASTVAVMILDTDSGELCWVCAGHPPPLVVDAHGGARCLQEGRGACLGVTGRPPFPEARTQIAVGSWVLLYSDGLIERRGTAFDEGIDRLVAATAQCWTTDPSRFVNQILDHMLAGHAHEDDVALVVAQLQGNEKCE